MKSDALLWIEDFYLGLWADILSLQITLKTELRTGTVVVKLAKRDRCVLKVEIPWSLRASKQESISEKLSRV